MPFERGFLVGCSDLVRGSSGGDFEDGVCRGLVEVIERGRGEAYSSQAVGRTW